MDQLLLRVDQAQKALGIGRTTMYELLKTGALQRVKIGRTTLIPSASVERLVARLTEEAGEAA